MNTIKQCFYLLLSCCVGVSCTNNDNQFYNATYLNATSNLLSIQAQNNYSVNDFLFVNANFSRYLAESGQSNLLDIYKTTGGATKFNFTYILEKKNSSNSWDLVLPTTSQFSILKGQVVANTYIYGSAIYNPTNQMYEYSVGVPLISSGQYRLSFGYNSDSVNTVEIRSESNENQLFLNINSPVSNLDDSGYYYFTVN